MQADLVARDLMAQGHWVYCPHKMSWGWERDKRLHREQSLELDKSFLKLWAEAIYRIPGESPGADGEVAYAKQLGLRILRPCPGKAVGAYHDRMPGSRIPGYPTCHGAGFVEALE